MTSYEQMPHPHWRDLPGYSPEDIATPLMAWINHALRDEESASMDPARMRAIEEQIERIFVTPAPQDGGSAERQQAMRDLALDWTLEEARTHAPANAPDWDRFARLIRDGGNIASGNYPGWWPLFRAFMAEEVKSNARVRDILAEQGIANLLELAADQKDAMAALTDAMTVLQVGLEIAFDEMRATLDELRAASGDLAGSAERIGAALARLDPAFARILDESSRSWHGVNPYTGEAEPLSARVRDRPTELLIARYRVAPFQDRGGLLASLTAWATTPSMPRAQGRLYVAPGGFGKTRLGIELIRALTQRGWRCSFLSQINAATLAPGSLPGLLRADGAAGVCVVVDYAEGQIERLLTLANAAHIAPAHGPPIRLLAFARSAESWWEEFAGDPGPSSVFAPDPFQEVGAVLSNDDRRRLFTSARLAFVNRLRTLGLAHRTQAAVPDVSRVDRPLTIAATAFLSARGIEQGGRSLFQTLYEEERRHWRRALGGLNPGDAGIDDLARAAAQVTLVQGATLPGAMALIQADPTPRVIAPPHVMTTLRRLYGRRVAMPGPEPGETTPTVFVGAIEPDLLGEHAAMDVLGPTGDGNGLLGATLRAALAGKPLFAEDIGWIITVLTRATRPDHDRSVFHTAEAAIRSIASMVQSLPAADVERLEIAVPEQSVAIRDLSAAVARQLVALAPPGQTVAELAERARRLGSLGNRLSALGRLDEALAASEEAVTLRRELVGRNRDAFLPDLARALGNLGNHLSDLGRRDEALAASEEAVTLYRDLVGRNRDAFLPDLASALNNLGIHLSNLGRRDEALAASEEAVTLYRDLVGRNRDAFLPELASALNNLGIRLSNLGRRDEALAASEEAVTLRRELVGRNRDAFLPDLARALGNLGNHLSDLGRRDEALAASEEAVTLRRELVGRNRDAFLPDLARALGNLGNHLSDLGRRDEALAASEEAVTLYRDLVGRNRDAFLPDLASALGNLGIRLSNLGRRDEALAASEEAVTLYRDLVGRNRDAFLPELASALNNLGIRLSNLGRRDEALAASEEAVTLRRELVGRNRDAFLPDLASALNNLGAYLSNLGRRDEALAASEEAVTLYRDLVGRNRDAFLPDLASALGMRGQILLVAGQAADAAAAFQEGAGLLGPFATSHPGAFGDMFQALLGGMAEAMRAEGRAEDVAAGMAEFEVGAIPDEPPGAPALDTRSPPADTE